jgi:hypothetical protein
VLAVVFLFASFLAQPFHEAMAAEETVPDTDETDVVADSVREQVTTEANNEDDVESDPAVESAETTAPATPETMPVEGADKSEEPVIESDDPAQVDAIEVTEASTTNEMLSSETALTATGSAAVIDPTDTQLANSNQTAPEETNNATTTSSTAPEPLEPVVETSSTTASSTVTSPLNTVTTTDQPAVTTDNPSGATGSGGGGTSNDAEVAPADDESSADTNTTPNPAADTTEATSTAETVVVNSEDDSDTPASASEQPEQQIVQAEILINDENYYQFSKQSCVAVGDGTYHCSENDIEQYDNQSVVYAEVGESGNLEIFLQTADGEVRQITDNEYDDASPYYDAETLQVVWQRLIDGRYQIVLYDINNGEESQLTFSRTNNMEPKVSTDGVVWQAWDNNDWEIMYFDGRFTDQITDNNVQDVAPVIQDRYVLWTVIGRGNQEGKVYSLDSQELLTISGHDGGVIENPRFVLVYDTKFDNGDIITQGFDPVTGVSEPLAAKPAPAPIDIPQPDPIGEIRALIQNKSTFEDDLEKQLVHTDSGTGSSTATSTDTLNLKQDDGAVQSTTTPDVQQTDFNLTEFDLILTPPDIDFTELDEIDDIIETEVGDTSTSSTQE